jgi:type I restriction enzyme S subunit
MNIVTRASLGQDLLKNLVVLLPPFAEQRSIASYLDEKCSEIDSLIAIKQAKIEELKEYKKSVIYEYVTGKKEVV